MYRYFLNTYRNSIPTGLPARLVDPTLRTIGEQPQFLRIGEGDHPTNELLRKVYQQPSKDEVRTKVLGDMFARDETNPYFNRPDNIAAIRSASEELGIPLERTGLRIATNPFRLEGDVADVNLLAQVTNKAAGNLKRSGKPTVANALTRKAQFFAQPTSFSEIAVDGTEGVEAILEAYNKAELRRTANSQGNRPILVQADGLDPNIGIPTGRVAEIPPDNIEGMKGANRYVDVSQGLETVRVHKYPNLMNRVRFGQQPRISEVTIPYAQKIVSEGEGEILSPKVSIETKRPRFIDEGTGIFTRQGEPINADQQNLLDTGMADLEDRSFILRDPEDLVRQPARALASRLPTNYYGIKRDIPTALRAEYGRTGRRGLTPTRDELPLTGEIGSVIGSQLNREQYRPTTRLGMEVVGLNVDRALDPVVIPSKDLWGTTVIPEKRIALRAATPISRLTDDLSNRVLSGEVDLRNYEPFKSVNTPQFYLDQSKDFVGPIRAVKDTTYGATQGKTPWREYYSDPFVYEDKGLDGEVSRLVKAVNEAPAQLENAYIQQANANRKAADIQDTINVVRRMGRGTITPQSDVFSLGINPELVVKPKSLFDSLKKDRRMAEIDAAKATDTIAQLKAAQELMGVEYMVKPKSFSPEVLQGYRMASQNKGAIKNQETLDYPSGSVLDPVDYENAMTDMGITGSRNLWRDEPDRDYDIASLFGFGDNY